MSATESMAQLVTKVEWIFEFWGGVFSPRPKVYSNLT